MKKFKETILFLCGIFVLFTSSCENTQEASLEGLFIINVSNQSDVINPVDIRVTIDSTVYIDQEFEVGDKHNWKEFTIELEKGPHTISVESNLANVTLEEQFVMTNDKHWGLLDYYNDPSRPNNTERFYFEFSDTEIGFM